MPNASTTNWTLPSRSSARTGNLADRQAEPTGQEQHLGVEGEAVQPAAAEHLERSLAAKALQAALGITERQAEQRPDGPVEQPAGQLWSAWSPQPSRDRQASAHSSPLVSHRRAG
jgi:hypothetical protein